ncbi:MAG: hypothetical protein EOO43_08610 [Flavobacterium sp.]|nr:MAG: hypothetical protein EOO43_08610 [Flavobacterium sp.]
MPNKKTERDLRRVKDLLNKTNQTAMVGGWELDLETNKVDWTRVTRDIFEVPNYFMPTRDTVLTFFKKTARMARNYHGLLRLQ